MDLLGVSRTIDHAVYTLLNSIAIILWRLDSALIGTSLFSYQTQDWLAGPQGGIWGLMAKLVGVNGLFGMDTLMAFMALALTLYGLSLIMRPFIRVNPVDPGRLLFYAVIAQVFITQGSELMRQAEAWRGEVGGFVYEAMSESDTADLGISGSGTDQLNAPRDLDGQTPIRGWEAVATSYFLVESSNDLHAGVPPDDFRVEYCLYDPAKAIDKQSQQNSAGCSPRKAWDEWDMVTIQPITQVLGIPIDVGVTLPIVQEHPENRQLGIRQAQEGVARLAMGPIVALFPIAEANVGLMLTLAASFVYLSLPLVVLFGFFLFTEPLVTRLFMQFINICLRTMILNGILALFMTLLMGAAAKGSLTIYLGLTGVGLIASYFMIKFASNTMMESLSTSLGAVGGVWRGAATGALGEGARVPAQAGLGLGKLALGGAALVAGGAMAGSLFQPAYETAKSGASDLGGELPSVDLAERKIRPGRLPDSIARITGGDNAPAAPGSAPGAADVVAPADQLPAVGMVAAFGAPAARWGLEGGQSSSPSRAPASPPASTPAQPAPWEGNQGAAGLPAPAGDGRAVETWVAGLYQARDRGQAGRQGQAQASETGRELLGESLGKEMERVAGRHGQEEIMSALRAARQVAVETEAGGRSLVRAGGSLDPEGLKAMRERMGGTAAAFGGARGERDLAILAAAGAQARKEAPPEEFQKAMAGAPDGRGERAAGRTVPRALGLDPVAAGEHFAGMNRFARLSQQAGLTPELRQRLLQEAQQDKVSDGLRRDLEAAIRRQPGAGKAAGVSVDALVARAQALPPTLRGPVAVRLPGGGQTPRKSSDAKRPDGAGKAAETRGAAGPGDQKAEDRPEQGGEEK